MKNTMSKLYRTPSFGTVFFDDEITQRPSQGGGIIGDGGDEFGDDASSQNVVPAPVLEDIAPNRIEEVLDAPVPATSEVVE